MESVVASSRFARELRRELPDWIARGWVTPAAAGELTARYPERSRRFGATVVLPVLGAALVLGGLILVLAHNWEELSRPFRAALALLPLAGTVWLGARTLARGGPAAAREAVAVANSLAVAAAISLVAQTYQISGDTPRFLLTWAALTLPGALLLRSAVAAALYTALAVAWGFAQRDVALAAGGLAGLLLGTVAWTVVEVRVRRRSLPVLGMVYLLGGLWLVPAALRGVAGAWILPGYLAWAALWTALSGPRPVAPASAATRFPAVIGIGAVGVLLSFRPAWRSLGGHWWSATRTSWETGAGIAWFCVLWALAAVAAVAAWRTADGVRRAWLVAPFVLGFLWLGHAAGLDLLWGVVAANVLLVGLGLVTFLDGWRSHDGFRLNFGWLLLGALMLVRFFDQDLSYLVRGVAFVALGVSFLVLNRVLVRRRAAVTGGREGGS